EIYKIVARSEPAGDCPTEAGVEICNDGIDNDGDGAIDREDDDCPGGGPCVFAFCGLCIVPGVITTIVGLVGLKRLRRRRRTTAGPAPSQAAQSRAAANAVDRRPAGQVDN
ncbi:MAG: hypothetical protein O7F76_09155, partial [Planctomycetota bacterium]|nr:hypothetical protein [Planctomycetota bacterium]